MLKTRRWCDPAEPDDGFRVLIARYRPRGVGAAQETWSGFMPQLGPSKALHAAAYGKTGATPLAWPTYAARYREEMRAQAFWIHNLAELHVRGETVTLLCSSACTDEARCHRSLLRELIEAEAERICSHAELRVGVRSRASMPGLARPEPSREGDLPSTPAAGTKISR